MIRYTNEQLDFLRTNQKKLTRRQLSELFNDRFNTDRSERAIADVCKRRKWYNDNLPGQINGVSWAKGLSGDEYRSHFTEESFRSLNKIKKTIGDEVVFNGFPYVFVSDDTSLKYRDRMIPKSRFVWERAYGSVLKGHVILHLDRNRMNCDLNNLISVPVSYMFEMNKNGWYKENADITLTAIKLCELNSQLMTNKRRKQNG